MIAAVLGLALALAPDPAPPPPPPPDRVAPEDPRGDPGPREADEERPREVQGRRGSLPPRGRRPPGWAPPGSGPERPPYRGRPPREGRRGFGPGRRPRDGRRGFGRRFDENWRRWHELPPNKRERICRMHRMVERRIPPKRWEEIRRHLRELPPEKRKELLDRLRKVARAHEEAAVRRARWIGRVLDSLPAEERERIRALPPERRGKEIARALEAFRKRVRAEGEKIAKRTFGPEEIRRLQALRPPPRVFRVLSREAPEDGIVGPESLARWRALKPEERRRAIFWLLPPPPRRPGPGGPPPRGPWGPGKKKGPWGPRSPAPPLRRGAKPDSGGAPPLPGPDRGEDAPAPGGRIRSTRPSGSART